MSDSRVHAMESDLIRQCERDQLVDEWRAFAEENIAEAVYEVVRYEGEEWVLDGAAALLDGSETLEAFRQKTVEAYVSLCLALHDDAERRMGGMDI